MKLVARVIAALAFVAFATPALPCGAEKAMKTAQTEQQQPSAQTEQQQPSGAVAKADKGEKSQKSEKSQKAKNVQAQKAAAN
jgi:hypothetical protein